MYFPSSTVLVGSVRPTSLLSFCKLIVFASPKGMLFQNFIVLKWQKTFSFPTQIYCWSCLFLFLPCLNCISDFNSSQVHLWMAIRPSFQFVFLMDSINKIVLLSSHGGFSILFLSSQPFCKPPSGGLNFSWSWDLGLTWFFLILVCWNPAACSCAFSCSQHLNVTDCTIARPS